MVVPRLHERTQCVRTSVVVVSVIHLLRQVLTAGLHLTHANYRLESTVMYVWRLAVAGRRTHRLTSLCTSKKTCTRVADTRAQQTGQLRSLEAICLVLTECRFLYVKQGAIHMEDMALLLRRFFHQGIFRWPQLTSPSACCQDTALDFAVPPDSEFV
ncbi:hypothetical protein Ae201684P_003132 [Aphanomyces euteiches]|nr:hypothetical protein Ae201684P_003132 [Aphanomyces euteiches]